MSDLPSREQLLKDPITENFVFLTCVSHVRHDIAAMTFCRYVIDIDELMHARVYSMVLVYI